MRYSDRVKFVTETAGGYNTETGEHDEGVVLIDVKPCNVSPIGVERSMQLFGEIDTSIIVARLQRPYNRVFDYVEVSGYKYNVKRHVPLRTESVFYLEGVKL